MLAGHSQLEQERQAEENNTLNCSFAGKSLIIIYVESVMKLKILIYRDSKWAG